jgi:AraC-like DNA-binding protein
VKGLSLARLYGHNRRVRDPIRFPGLLGGFHRELPGHPSGLLHGGEAWAAPAFFISAHRHDVWELHLQVEGTSRWTAGDVDVTLGPGHLLAVPPGFRHGMTLAPPGRHYFRYAAFDATKVVARWPALAADWTRPKVLHVEDAASADRLLRLLVRELGHALPLVDEGLSCVVDLLAIEAARLFRHEQARPLTGVVHPAVASARSLLDTRYSEPWTVGGLARAVGLSQAHLSELFSHEVGVTVHRYLVARRVEAAIELLSGSDLPIVDVATGLGFASGSHLARVFRDLLGQKPSDFRRASRPGATTPAARPVRSSGETAGSSAGAGPG